jgi:tetratricopeptide (TPR) repeat protein
LRHLAVAFFATARALSAQVSPAEIEEASETGRRAAVALLRGDRRVLQEAFAADSIAVRFLGEEVWRGLSDRQRDRIRSLVRERFAEALEPPRGSVGDVAWSSARGEDNTVLVFLGLRYPAGVLKTRWSLSRAAGGWRVQDVVLSDPGLSLAADAGRSFGSGTVRQRNRGSKAWAAALPRAVGLAAILAILLFVGRRLAPAGRRLLLLTAAAPAILFLVDGFLAVQRVLSEPYLVPEVLSAVSWQGAERAALAAQREGRLGEARREWERAVAAGAPASPADYQLGLALKAAGRIGEAKEAFLRALSRSPAAPGASKELGLLALADGNSAEARDRLRRYHEEAGPDPDALSALAVAEANLGQKERAVESVEQARMLVADRWNGVRLQAQVYARAGDAEKAVETLRVLEPNGLLDRESLRSDPTYLPIATDPAWVKFLSETPAPKE